MVRRAVRFLEDAESLGLDRSALLAAADLQENMLLVCEDRMPLESFWNLVTAAIIQSGDPWFGLQFGRMTEVRDWGVVGYLLQFSGDLGDAFDRLVQYAPIISSAATLETVRECDRLILTGQPSPLSGLPSGFFDYLLASVVQMIRLIAGEDLNPIEVGSPGRRPESTEEHRRFFSCPVSFGVEQPRIVFPGNVARRPLLQRDEAFARELSGPADRQLSSLSAQAGFLGQVREVMWRHLNDGKPQIEPVASELAMSARSLQRRLRAEETSFTEVIDEMRRTMALSLLADPSLAVYEISVLLGYSEPSAFHRGFKRWTGLTPEEHRQARR